MSRFIVQVSGMTFKGAYAATLAELDADERKARNVFRSIRPDVPLHVYRPSVSLMRADLLPDGYRRTILSERQLCA